MMVTPEVNKILTRYTVPIQQAMRREMEGMIDPAISEASMLWTPPWHRLSDTRRHAWYLGQRG